MNENLTRHILKAVTLSQCVIFCVTPSWMDVVTLLQGAIFCVTHPCMEGKSPFMAQPPEFANFFCTPLTYYAV